MTGRKIIEARLDRSLEHQIKVPRLDPRFDAAVWARIEKAESRATNPGRELAAADEFAPQLRAARATRWLAVSNGIGATIAVALVIYFVLRMFAGSDVSMNVNVSVPVPQVTQAMATQIISVLGYVLGGAMFLLGIGLTSYGRRLRSTFSGA